MSRRAGRRSFESPSCPCRRCVDGFCLTSSHALSHRLRRQGYSSGYQARHGLALSRVRHAGSGDRWLIVFQPFIRFPLLPAPSAADAPSLRQVQPITLRHTWCDCRQSDLSESIEPACSKTVRAVQERLSKVGRTCSRQGPIAAPAPPDRTSRRRARARSHPRPTRRADSCRFPRPCRSGQAPCAATRAGRH